MNIIQLLNITGLLFGILGVIIIFFWGPPQPKLEEGVGRILEDNTPIDETGKTVKENNEEIKARKRMFARMSRLGLVFVLVGFILQLIAACVN